MTKAPRSWQVQLASALVGLGVVVGAGMVVGALMLMRGDPGFLFAILPIVFLVLSVAGVTIATFSLGLVVQLQRAAPGARLQVALLGGCLVASGLFVVNGSLPAAVVLVAYGGTLLWLMTTPAAARDLGSWTAHEARRAWFTSAAPGAGSAATPRPWWETWRDGVAQGMPRWELALVAVALLAFAVGLVALPLGFTVLPAARPLAMVLIPLALAVVWLVEQRMRGRLGGRRGAGH